MTQYSNNDKVGITLSLADIHRREIDILEEKKMFVQEETKPDPVKREHNILNVLDVEDFKN